MRKEAASERVRVSSLAELDAVVGRYLTGETPRSHWEDSHTHFRFDSVEEALEALHDPYFRQFVAEEAPTTTVLTEVKEFRRYSSDLNAAWDLVEKLNEDVEPLQVRREDGRWLAAFGKRAPAAAGTAPVAICLAALRVRGVEVECDVEQLERAHREAMGADGVEIKSFYR